VYAVEQYIIGKAVVRLHGSTDQERLKAATKKFLKKAERIRNEQNKKKDTVQQKN
jgi:hypothetical protein